MLYVDLKYRFANIHTNHIQIINWTTLHLQNDITTASDWAWKGAQNLAISYHMLDNNQICHTVDCSVKNGSCPAQIWN